MIKLLYTAAGGTLPNRHQKAVGLGDFRVVQAIKRIVKENLKRAVSGARLSHAVSEYSETRPTHASRSLRSSGHFFSHTPEEDLPFPLGA
jgi:hypothetical protein